jgi:hypothetical protein
MHPFDARDEGPVTRYVGVDIHRVKDRIYLTQTPLIQELVDTLGLSECNPTLTQALVYILMIDLRCLMVLVLSYINTQ